MTSTVPTASTERFELTEGEEACGVTLEDVHDLRWQALVFDGRSAVALPAGTAPALAGSTARYALGAPVEFVGFNELGHPVYRIALEPEETP